MQLSSFALASTALALVACSRAPSTGPGAERQPCRSGNACDRGLMCLSDRCVRPPPADCTAVAAHAASFRLGNYATPEERGPVIAEYQAACAKAHVSKEQGACLLAAGDKWSAAQCVPAMFPDVNLKDGSCDAVGAKIGEMISREMTSKEMVEMRDRVIKVIVASCREDAWPDKLKACMVAAKPTPDGMKACENLMPKELERKVSERMAKAM